MEKKRLLFIPVSSSEGIGEYMRSLSFAHYLDECFPDRLDIHFLLNKHTNYALDCPFDTTLIEQSATKETRKVNQLIEAFKPNLVVFDCAGRAAQMKTAKRAGAKVVFISQHNKKRAKGLKLNRLNLIDRHWVAQPDYCIEKISFSERLKLKLFPLSPPVNVGSFFSQSSSSETYQLLAQLNLTNEAYFLVNAGSGGHGEKNQLFADVFYQAAKKIATETGLKGVVVFGSNYPNNLPEDDNLIILKSLHASEFVGVLANAKFAVLSAGDSLLQAISLKVPTVAAAISKDQPKRLQNCVDSNLTLAADPTLASLSDAVKQLLVPATYQATKNVLAKIKPHNAKKEMLQGVSELLFGISK